MKVYTYTKEELAVMTEEMVNKAIAEIEADAGYRSACFADRLHGTEAEEFQANERTFQANERTLVQLRQWLFQELNFDYWLWRKEEAEKGLKWWEAEKADESISYIPADHPDKKIAECEADIALCESKMQLLIQR